MNREYIKCGELPMGLSMALAENPEAMKAFSLMDSSQRSRVISGCHGIGSKAEMKQYVSRLCHTKY